MSNESFEQPPNEHTKQENIFPTISSYVTVLKTLQISEKLKMLITLINAS